MNKTQIFTCGLFAVMIFVVVVASTSTNYPEEVAQIQLPLQTVPQAVGIFVSGAASLAVLLKALGGADLKRVAPFVIPVFAGLLLIQVHWTLAISLGLIALGPVIRSNLEPFARSQTETPVHVNDIDET